MNKQTNTQELLKWLSQREDEAKNSRKVAIEITDSAKESFENGKLEMIRLIIDQINNQM